MAFDSDLDRQDDARRRLAALRRSFWLIAGCSLALGAIVLLVSLTVDDRYTATATLIQEEVASAFGQTDAEAQRRRLETIATLATTTRVLTRAVADLPGETTASLESDIEARLDETANLIDITAGAGDPVQAARRANRVALAVVEERGSFERRLLERARENLTTQLEQLRGMPGTDGQVAALRRQITDLGVQLATAGGDLQLAQAAPVPAQATSPRPLRNAIIGLVAGVFLGVLLALAREQLVPRPRDARELGQVARLPVLVEIPDTSATLRRRRAILRAAESESYGALRTGIELALPPTEQRVVLVTSALHGEGKTTVTARLASALASAGHPTLMVSADLRRPELHRHFGTDVGPGFAEVLDRLEGGDSDSAMDLMQASVKRVEVHTPRRGSAVLDLLPSGGAPEQASQVISLNSVSAFLDVARHGDYQYVILDAPPLLGLSDTQVMAQVVGNLLVVSRLDRIALDRVGDLRDALNRVGADVLGLVVIGGRTETSPYYLPATQRSGSVPAGSHPGLD